jgi:hypothetical protein
MLDLTHTTRLDPPASLSYSRCELPAVRHEEHTLLVPSPLHEVERIRAGERERLLAHDMQAAIEAFAGVWVMPDMRRGDHGGIEIRPW